MKDHRRVTIDTYYDPKPIPVRHFDWCAMLDGYDKGDPIGHGLTEAEAVMDLYIQIADKEEEEELQR